jgi:hypothetical protein
MLAPFIPAVDLDNAVVHDGSVPFYLAARFQAIARGRHIYLRTNVYDDSRPEGLALLGHELVHVGQYRRGMNWLSYLWSARRGYSNSRYEREACAVQRRILLELAAGTPTGRLPLTATPA